MVDFHWHILDLLFMQHNFAVRLLAPFAYYLSRKRGEKEKEKEKKRRKGGGKQKEKA